jgi:hypothetical protein
MARISRIAVTANPSMSPKEEIADSRLPSMTPTTRALLELNLKLLMKYGVPQLTSNNLCLLHVLRYVKMCKYAARMVLNIT